MLLSNELSHSKYNDLFFYFFKKPNASVNNNEDST
jgi:hypothetical protein